MRLGRCGIPILVLLLVLPGVAWASLISFDSRAAFSAAGTIVENYGFEDVPPGGLVWPFDRTWPSLWGEPFGTHHGITYASTSAFLIGPGIPYSPGQDPWAPISTVLIEGWMTPIAGVIDTSARYDMFGVDLAHVGAYNSDMYLHLFTNLAEYTFPPLTLPNLNTAHAFYGWSTGSGEYFTGFSIGSSNGNRSGPAVDNLTLGYAAPATVPEPATLVLLGSGLAAAGIGRARKQRP